MKILLVHNFYGSDSPSGENTVFEAENELLNGKDHHVVAFTRHSDEIRKSGIWGLIKASIIIPWNWFSFFRTHFLSRSKIFDVMHVHNTFPLISPSVFYALKGGASVLTLHNYRLFCAAGIPVRDDKPCTLCLDRKSVFHALRYGCYRGSRMATIPLAFSIAFHRRIGTWTNHVHAFIALTEFQRQKMIEAGLPSDRVHVKPHFYFNPPIAVPWCERTGQVVFVGRLGKEKGVKYLVEAWCMWGQAAPILDVIGDGPEGDSLRAMVHKHAMEGKINFLGRLSFEETQIRIADSKLLILPSICFEGFPMVIREAFALGTPVAASNLGSMASLVTDGENGVLFEVGDVNDLLQTVRAALSDDAELMRMALNARHEFEDKYTAEANYKMLMDIYQTAIAVRKQALGHGD